LYIQIKNIQNLNINQTRKPRLWPVKFEPMGSFSKSIALTRRTDGGWLGAGASAAVREVLSYFFVNGLPIRKCGALRRPRPADFGQK
jgi:hypothetical protein